MNTYKLMDASTLYYQGKKKALALLLFITEKKNGDIKARNVDVGNNCRRSDYPELATAELE